MLLRKIRRVSSNVGKTFALPAVQEVGVGDRKKSECRRVFSSVRPQGSNNEGKPATRDGSPVSWHYQGSEPCLPTDPPGQASDFCRRECCIARLRDGNLPRVGGTLPLWTNRAWIVRHPDTTVLCNGFCGNLFPLKIRLQPYTNIYTCEQPVTTGGFSKHGEPIGPRGGPLRGSFPTSKLIFYIASETRPTTRQSLAMFINRVE
jgi:hypothetical protein